MPGRGDPSVELDGCNGLDDLPANYAKLQAPPDPSRPLRARLEEAFGAEAAGRVVLAGYPQLTRDESREPCGWSAGDDPETGAGTSRGSRPPRWSGRARP